MLKGILEGMVLEMISQGEIYGYALLRRLTSLGFEGIAEGTVYALLVRLERNRWVAIRKEPSEIGPPRKFYTLSPRGAEELRGFWKRWTFLCERVDELKEKGGTPS